jgi:hypothetical protein
MEEQQQRRLEIIRTCLNQLEKYFVGSQCATIITEAQVQLDKLHVVDAPDGASTNVVQPISHDEATRAHARGVISFPQGLLLWVNNELVKNYDPTNGSSHIEAGRAPAYEGHNLLSCKVLGALFSATGWNVQQAEPGIIVFSKRDEKQTSSIN